MKGEKKKTDAKNANMSPRSISNLPAVITHKSVRLQLFGLSIHQHPKWWVFVPYSVENPSQS